MFFWVARMVMLVNIRLDDYVLEISFLFLESEIN
jgi:hypothetical protein